MLGSKKHREQSWSRGKVGVGRWGVQRRERPGRSPPLESRLWALLSGGAGVGRELEAGLRALWGGEKVTVGGSRIHRQEEGV